MAMEQSLCFEKKGLQANTRMINLFRSGESARYRLDQSWPSAAERVTFWKFTIKGQLQKKLSLFDRVH